MYTSSYLINVDITTRAARYVSKRGGGRQVMPEKLSKEIGDRDIVVEFRYYTSEVKHITLSLLNC